MNQKNKRLLCVFCTALLLLPLFQTLAPNWTGNAAAAKSGETDGFSWTIDADGVMTVSGEGMLPCVLEAPSGIVSADDPHPDNSGNPTTRVKKLVIKNGITGIGAEAFYRYPALTSVSLPDGLRCIARNAFRECRLLSEINFPKSLQIIGMYAFAGCESLTEADLPDTIVGLGEGIFFECSGLKQAHVPNAIKHLDYKMFAECTALESVELPAGLEVLNTGVFEGCTSLTSISLPDTVTVLGISTFSQCEKLKTINEPPHLDYIDSGALNGTPWLDNQPNGPVYFSDTFLTYKGENDVQSIKIREGITTIASFAFGSFSQLTEITLPSTLVNICESAFRGCTHLQDVELPDHVEEIGDNTFYGCSRLSSIHAPENLTKLGEGVFTGTAWLDAQPDGPVYFGNVLYKYKGTMPPNTVVAVEEGTASITSRAFADCVGLTRVTLPDSVKRIGSWAFSGCSDLSDIALPGTVEEIGGEAFSGTAWINAQPPGLQYHQDKLYWYQGEMPENSEIEIQEGTRIIAAQVFVDKEELGTVHIPASLEEISAYAFADCYNIHTVYYGGSAGDWANIRITERNSELYNALFIFEGGDSVGGSLFGGNTNTSDASAARNLIIVAVGVLLILLVLLGTILLLRKLKKAPTPPYAAQYDRSRQESYARRNNQYPQQRQPGQHKQPTYPRQQGQYRQPDDSYRDHYRNGPDHPSRNS